MNKVNYDFAACEVFNFLESAGAKYGIGFAAERPLPSLLISCKLLLDSEDFMAGCRTPFSWVAKGPKGC